jgi:hypothetical protein
MLARQWKVSEVAKYLCAFLEVLTFDMRARKWFLNVAGKYCVTEGILEMWIGSWRSVSTWSGF